MLTKQPTEQEIESWQPESIRETNKILRDYVFAKIALARIEDWRECKLTELLTSMEEKQNTVHECRNFRPNRECRQLPGATFPHKGQIIADLYLNGVFVREAIVADVGRAGNAEAYCQKANAATKDTANIEEQNLHTWEGEGGLVV
jgi:hypothetical protein